MTCKNSENNFPRSNNIIGMQDRSRKIIGVKQKIQKFKNQNPEYEQYWRSQQLKLRC